MKELETIYREMLEDYSGKTGLAVSDMGDMSVRLYAMASQVYSLWVQSEFMKKQAFPHTATGEYLELHASVRGLSRADSACAFGIIRFCLNEAAYARISFSSGVRCLTAAGTEYVTTQDGTIEQGESYCEVQAVAASPGTAGNVPAGSITIMALAPNGVSSCYNPQGFTGGADAEDDEQLRERVLNTYRKLPNGANAAYYETTVLGVEGVASVSVLPKSRGIGTVDIVIAALDGIPGGELIGTVQQLLDSQREICVDIQVLAPEAVNMDIGLSVKVADGYEAQSVLQKVQTALRSYFTGQLLGGDVLLAALGYAVFSVGGVENYAFSAPSADIKISNTQLPVIGAISISLMEDGD